MINVKLINNITMKKFKAFVCLVLLGIGFVALMAATKIDESVMQDILEEKDRL